MDQKIMMRSKTFTGAPMKLYISRVAYKKSQVIMFKKLILTKDPRYIMGFTLLKTYKDYYLVETLFSLKRDTFNLIYSALNDGN